MLEAHQSEGTIYVCGNGGSATTASHMANDYNKGNAEMYSPVVGVDANASALDAMDRGEMLGTVLNDADGQGTAAVKLAVALANGKDVSGQVVDGKYIWVPYQKVTRGENK